MENCSFCVQKNSIELPSACCACLSFMFVKFYILCRYIHISPSAAQSPLQLTYQIKFTYLLCRRKHFERITSNLALKEKIILAWKYSIRHLQSVFFFIFFSNVSHSWPFLVSLLHSGILISHFFEPPDKSKQMSLPSPR